MDDHETLPAGCWIFGYGSLIWRPDFPYIERYVARLDGWKRRFWQGSVDHRGVPEAPGRVVTLLPDPYDVTWGAVFRLGEEVRANVMHALDVRERGGYARHEAPVKVIDAPFSVVHATFYVATPENRNYAGPASLEDIAAQVRRSEGPSGPNAEYVLELARSLEEMGVVDRHVRDLAALVRRSS